MGINVRQKGHSFERAIAKILRPFYPEVKRHLEYQKAEAKGFDLDNTGRLKIQCKRGKKYAPLSKIKEPQCKGDEIPVLITKADHERPIVAFYLDDLLKLAEANSGE